MRRIPEGCALVRIADLAQLQADAGKRRGGQCRIWLVTKEGARHELVNVGLATGVNRVLDPAGNGAPGYRQADGSSIEVQVTVL